MKLIDGDSLKRTCGNMAAQELYTGNIEASMPRLEGKLLRFAEGYQMALNHVAEVIDYTNSIDAVEVVRCNDCRHASYICGFMGRTLFCNYWDKNTDANGYCHEGV